MLSDMYLDELRQIKHVQVIRIGICCASLPHHPKLAKMLKKHYPLRINMHFNHPRKITTSSRQVLCLLPDAGILPGNQAVLLVGGNDSPRIIKSLVHKLAATRVHLKMYPSNFFEGVVSFLTLRQGIGLMESLILRKMIYKFSGNIKCSQK